mgnify:CR=1 FL=1
MGYTNTPEGKDFKEKIGDRQTETSYELVPIYRYEPGGRSARNLLKAGSLGLKLGRDVIFLCQFIYVFLF